MLFLTRLLTGCPAEARALRGDECGQAAFTVTQCVQGEAFSIGLILLKGLRLESQSSSPGLHRCHVSWLSQEANGLWALRCSQEQGPFQDTSAF